MPQPWCLFDDPQTGELIGSCRHRRDDFTDVVDVALVVSAAGYGQPDELDAGKVTGK